MAKPQPIHTAHFEFVRMTNSLVIYRLEASGHCIYLPKAWFPQAPRQEITIEITDRQLPLLEAVEQTNAQ